MAVVNEKLIEKKKQKKYNVPVIGHFADKSIRFNSILQASEVTGIHHHLIFEATVGKIKKARNIHWEYENGVHYLKYKAHFIRHKKSYNRFTGFNG